MTKNAFFLFTASCLSLFVPVPPRFGYGLILVLCTNIIVFSVLLLQTLIDYLKIKKYKNLFFVPGTLGITMLLYGILTLWSPLIAFTFGFIIYLIPVSLFISNSVFVPVASSLKNAAYRGAKNSLVLSILGLLFFMFRELLAYGSLSLPVRSGLQSIQLFENIQFAPVFFWSTIPGAFVLLAGMLVILSLIYTKYNIKEGAQK